MGAEENYLDNLLKAITEPDEAQSTEEIIADEELNLDAVPDISDVEPEVELSDMELSDIELQEVETSVAELSDEEDSDTEFTAADLVTELFEEAAGDTEPDNDISIDGLDEVIQSATELELAGELDISDLGVEELETKELDLETDNDELKIDDLNIEDVDSNTDLNLDSDAGEDGELSLDDVQLDDIVPDGETEIRAQEPSVDVEPAGDTSEELLVEELSSETSSSETSSSEELSSETPNIEDEIDIPDISPEESAQIAAELNLDSGELPDLDKDDMDDGLDDVLSLLDSEADSDLAEINNMLKKSDNNEPIQDDMMEMLHQMADNEAAFVNAGEADMDDSDEGAAPPNVDVVKRVEKKKAEEDETKKKKPEKAKKKKAKKKKNGADDEVDVLNENDEKEPGALGKLFNILTEDLVPEPTEEELAAEKEAKAAKKQENMTKKEAEKAAKDEAKKAEKEAKDAEKKAAAAAAEQKKKEKKAANEAKKAAKAAKKAAENVKRIPPKKIAVGALFGATVCGAILIATSVLASQGYIQKAKSAYYDGDYMTVYLSTYGMELDASDDIIRGRSEAILKMQRKYDSYEINMKLGRELEALDALIGSLATYDYINTEAEQYGVLAEVDAIKDQILNTLLVNYGLDEAAAREILQNEDDLSYTMALYNVIRMN